VIEQLPLVSVLPSHHRRILPLRPPQQESPFVRKEKKKSEKK